MADGDRVATKDGVRVCRTASLSGVGVGDCVDAPDRRLDHAVRDVDDLVGPVRGFSSEVLRNPTQDEMRDYLAGLEDSLPEGGPLVLVWSGHGIASDFGYLHCRPATARPAPSAALP